MPIDLLRSPIEYWEAYAFFKRPKKVETAVKYWFSQHLICISWTDLGIYTEQSMCPRCMFRKMDILNVCIFKLVTLWSVLCLQRVNTGARQRGLYTGFSFFFFYKTLLTKKAIRGRATQLAQMVRMPGQTSRDKDCASGRPLIK